MPGSTAGHQGAEAATFVDYGALIRRQWPVIAVGIVLGLLAGMAFLLQQPASYTSSTTVLVRTTPGVEGAEPVGVRTTGSINLDTEAQIARSATIAQRVRESLAVEDPTGSLTSRLTVRVPPNSEVLVFDYTAESGALAAEGSQAFAEAYLSNRSETASATLETRRTGLDNQLAELSRELDLAVTQIAATEDGSREESLAVSVRNGVERQMAELESAKVALALTTPTPGEIITPPGPGQADTRARALVALVSGAFAGLLLGIGGGLVRDRTSRRLRDDDLEALARRPVLARIPGAVGIDAGLPLTPSQTSALVRLRNVLLHLTSPAPVMVLIAGPGDGGTSHGLARAVADVLTRTEGPVALVDVVDGEVTVRETAGGTPLGTQYGTAEAILARLRRSHRHVVVSVPGMGAGSDAQTLAPTSDIVLLAVDEGVTDRPQLADAVEQLDAVAARVGGVVLVQRDRGRPRPVPPEAPRPQTDAVVSTGSAEELDTVPPPPAPPPPASLPEGTPNETPDGSRQPEPRTPTSGARGRSLIGKSRQVRSPRSSVVASRR